MLHLNRLSRHSNETGMTSKNLAIVWAPNLIRTAAPTPTTPPTSPTSADNKAELIRLAQEQQARLQFSLVQNTQIVQYLIDNARWLFESRPSVASNLSLANNNVKQPLRTALTTTAEPTKASTYYHVLMSRQP